MQASSGASHYLILDKFENPTFDPQIILISDICLLVQCLLINSHRNGKMLEIQAGSQHMTHLFLVCSLILKTQHFKNDWFDIFTVCPTFFCEKVYNSPRRAC